MSQDGDHIVWGFASLVVAFLLAIASYNLGVYIEKSRSSSYKEMTISERKCDAMFEERFSQATADVGGELLSQIMAFEFASKRRIGSELEDLCIRVFDAIDDDRHPLTDRY